MSGVSSGMMPTAELEVPLAVNGEKHVAVSKTREEPMQRGRTGSGVVQNLLRCFREPTGQLWHSSCRRQSSIQMLSGNNRAVGENLSDKRDSGPPKESRLGDVLRNLDCLNRDSTRGELKCQKMLKDSEEYNCLLTRLLEKYSGSSSATPTRDVSKTELKQRKECFQKEETVKETVTKYRQRGQKHAAKTRAGSDEEDPLEYFKSLYLQDRLSAKETRSQLYPNLDSHSDSFQSNATSAINSLPNHTTQLQHSQTTSPSPVNTPPCEALVEHDDSGSTPESVSEVHSGNDLCSKEAPPETTPSNLPSLLSLDVIVSDLIEGVVHNALDTLS